MSRLRTLSVLTLALTGLVAGTTGCAPASGTAPTQTANAATPRACFYTDRVQDYRAGPDNTLYVRDLSNGVFLLQTRNCRGLNGSAAIAFEGAPAVPSLCTGDHGLMAVSSPGLSGTPCRVQVVRALDAEEIAQLPAHLRP